MNELQKNNVCSKLYNYAITRKCTGDKIFTHTWWDHKRTFTFKVDDNEYDDFINIYYKELSNSKTNHIMEKMRDIGPLCLDFDFKQPKSKRLIEINDIILVIESINEIILNNFTLSDPENQLQSSVLMKKKPFYNEQKNIYSDGFHIQYPNLILDSTERYLIYDESKKEIN
jgi:hypothetical protein